MLVAQNSLGPVCPVPLTVRGRAHQGAGPGGLRPGRQRRGLPGHLGAAPEPRERAPGDARRFGRGGGMRSNGPTHVVAARLRACACARRPAVDKVRNFGLKTLIPLGNALDTCERAKDEYSAYRARPCKAIKVCRTTACCRRREPICAREAAETLDTHSRHRRAAAFASVS